MPPCSTQFTKPKNQSLPTLPLPTSWPPSVSQTNVQHLTSVDPKCITSYSLHSGGATTLLVTKVNPKSISLVGCRRSDAMLRYLCIQALTKTHNHAYAMLNFGNFTFHSIAKTSQNLAYLPYCCDPTPAKAEHFIQTTLLDPILDADLPSKLLDASMQPWEL
jgi:hypothetical protein